MKLRSIQYVRGVAALLVVIFHIGVYSSRIQGSHTLSALWGVVPGLLGVIAFFVVSGFLMAEIAPQYDWATFLLHRVSRIYPAYWACVGLAAIWYFALGQITANHDHIPEVGQMLFGQASDALRLTLVPVPFPDYPLAVEWTLLYETTFYVLVTVAILSRCATQLVPLCAGWLVVIGAAIVLNPQGQLAYTRVSLASLLMFGINAAFIFGVAISRFKHLLAPAHSLAFGLLLIATVGYVPSPWNMVHACLSIAAMVASLIALDLRGKLPDIRALHLLGDWSYAMYLIHSFLIIGTLKLLGPSAALPVTVAAALFVVIAGAALLGNADKAAYRLLKRKVDALPAALRKSAAASYLCAFLAAGMYGATLLSLRP